MKSKNIPAIVILVVLLAVLGSIALAAQDRFTLKAPNGVAFSEIRGYETWQDVAVSQTEDGLPDTLKSVAFIQKDSKRFPDTSGWGYAQFLYDAATDTFKPIDLRRDHDILPAPMALKNHALQLLSTFVDVYL
jgi:hypothetical protein